MATYKTKIELDADATPMSAALKRARADMDKLSGSFKSAPADMMTKSLGGLATAMGPAALAGSVTAFMKASFDYAGQMADMAEQTGLTATQAAELHTSFKATGLAGDAFIPVMTKLNKELSEAAIGGSAQNKALEQLGLSIGDLINLNPAEKLAAIANAIDPKNPADMSAAFDLLGKSASKILPALQAVGGTLTNTDEAFDNAAQRADQLGDLLDELWAKTKRGAATTTMALLETLGEVFTLGGGAGESIGSIEKATKNLNDELLTMNSIHKERLALQNKDAAEAQLKSLREKSLLENESLQTMLLQASQGLTPMVSLSDELLSLTESREEAENRAAESVRNTAVEVEHLDKKILALQESNGGGRSAKEYEKELKSLMDDRKDALSENNKATKELARIQKDEITEIESAQKKADDARLAAQEKLNDEIEREKTKRMEAAKAGLAMLDRIQPKNDATTRKETRTALGDLQSETMFGKDPDKINKLLEKIEPNMALALKQDPREIGGFDQPTIDAIMGRARGVLSGNLAPKVGLPAAGGVPGLTAPGAASKGQDLNSAVNAYQAQMLAEVSAIRGAVVLLGGNGPLSFK